MLTIIVSVGSFVILAILGVMYAKLLKDYGRLRIQYLVAMQQSLDLKLQIADLIFSRDAQLFADSCYQEPSNFTGVRSPTSA